MRLFFLYQKGAWVQKAEDYGLMGSHCFHEGHIYGERSTALSHSHSADLLKASVIDVPVLRAGDTVVNKTEKVV